MIDQLSLSFDFEIPAVPLAPQESAETPPVVQAIPPRTPTNPASRRDHGKQLVKLLRECSYRHNLWDVFGDFVEASVLSIANACDPTQRDTREARYMEIVKRYTKEELGAFPRMLWHLIEALESEPGDVLGSIFGELDLGNSARGQFFTPYEVCRLMAGITVGDGEEVRRLIEERGFFRVHEPAVGAGAMIVALAMHLQDQGINYQRHMHVTAVDIDRRAVHMAYLQFSLLYIPATVVVGNTLSMQEFEHWHTPAHMLDGWNYRLAASQQKEAA